MIVSPPLLLSCNQGGLSKYPWPYNENHQKLAPPSSGSLLEISQRGPMVENADFQLQQTRTDYLQDH